MSGFHSRSRRPALRWCSTGLISAVAACVFGSIATIALPWAASAATYNTAPISGLSTPWGIAFDAVGDLFVANSNANTVVVLPKSSGTIFGQSVTAGDAVTLNAATGLDGPAGLAFDAAGDLFIGNNVNFTISVVPKSTGTIFGQSVTADTTARLAAATGLNGAFGLAFDAAGDLFDASEGNSTVAVIPASTGTIFGQSVTADTTTNFLTWPNVIGPSAVAFDAAGDLFETNLQDNTITVDPASTRTIFGQSFTADVPARLNAVSGLQAPWAMTFDTAGDLYIANDAGDGHASVIPVSSGTLFGQAVTANTTNTLLDGQDGVYYSYGIEFDATGDLYSSNEGNNTVTELQGATPQTVNFTSSDPSPTYGSNYTPTATISPATVVPPTFSIDAGSDPGACQISAGVVAFTRVANCVIDANVAGSAGLEAGSSTQTIAVTQAPVVVTASSATMNFGDVVPTITPAITGLERGEAANKLGTILCSTTATSSSPAGIYTSSCTGGSDPNYSVSHLTGEVTLDATAPGAPTGVSASAGDASITATWTAPSSTGGSPIVSYTLTATPDGGGSPISQNFFSSATTETLTGLVNATPYDVTVAADNAEYAASGAAAAATDNPVTPEPLTQAITFTSMPPTSPAFSSTYTVTATGGPSSNDVTFTIDAATTGSACSITGDVVSFDHAGTCVIDANQLGDGLFGAAPQVQQQVVVAQVTPIITWSSPSAVTYGTPLGSSELDATASVPGTFTYLPGAGTTLDAGSRVLAVGFTPTNGNDYATRSGSTTLTVNKATPTLTWPTSAPITFGTELSSNQLDATSSVPGTFTYLPGSGTMLDAGNQALSVDFTPTSSNDYASVSVSTTLTVNKATPTLIWPTPAVIASGTGLSSDQLDATASVPGAFSYSPALGTVEGAGTDTITATFTPTDSTNYASATSTVTVQVGEATPTITWPTPAPISSGTALGSSQLDATANVAGTFSYQPPSGTVPAVGSDTLSVKFTPNDTANELAVTKTVTLVVNKSTPNLMWTTPTGITYGSVLGSSQLNAGSSVTGTFTYSPAAGATPRAGTATLSATFVPDDTADYSSATVQTTLLVGQATPTITWTPLTAIPAGTELDSSELDATASVPGTFTYSPAAGVIPDPGTTTLSVAFTPTDSTDYASATQTASLVVNPAPAVISPSPSTTSTTLAPSVSATPLPAAPSGTVNIVFGFQPGAAITAGEVHVRGHDFLPGSTVTIIAHSAPTLLGTAKVSRNGIFSTVVTLPARLEVGAHHIIVRGTLDDGTGVASEEAFTVAAGGLLGTVGSVPPGPLANDVAFVPAAHRATVLATAAGGAVAIGAVASSLGGGFSGSRSGGTGGSSGGGSSGGGGGYLEDVELEQAEAEMEGGFRGDQSRTWRWPMTRRLDRFSARYPSLVAAVSPVAGRVIIDGAYLRAMFGSVWLFMCLAAVGLGSYASASTGWYAIPPSLPIFLAVLGLSIFDATLGYLAGAAFLAGALFSGHITSAMELRTGAGIVLLWFAVPLAAAALRPLRRSLTFNLLGLWDRTADFVIGGLFAAWAAEKMIGALSGLAGVELPIAKDVNTIAFAVLAFVGARIILETIAVHHYPTRLEHVRHRGDLESGNLQVGLSLIIQMLLFLFISVAFMGSTWGLYVGCAVFFSPLVPWLFADKIPKSKFVTKWKPTGLVNWALIIVTGVLLSRLLDHLVHSDHLVEVLGFIVLPLPVLISWGLELFEAEEEEEKEEAESGAEAEATAEENHDAPDGEVGELLPVLAYAGAARGGDTQLSPLLGASAHHGAEEFLEAESARSKFRAEEEEREESRAEHLEAEAAWKAWLTRLAGVPLVVVCVYLVVTHIAGG